VSGPKPRKDLFEIIIVGHKEDMVSYSFNAAMVTFSELRDRFEHSDQEKHQLYAGLALLSEGLKILSKRLEDIEHAVERKK